MDKYLPGRAKGVSPLAALLAAWPRAAAAASIVAAVAGVIFYAGASYQRIDDISARLAGLSTKVDRVDSSMRSIETQVAEIAGSLRMRRADSTP